MTTNSVKSKPARIRIKTPAKQHQLCSFNKIKLLGPQDIFVACLKLQCLLASRMQHRELWLEAFPLQLSDTRKRHPIWG